MEVVKLALMAIQLGALPVVALALLLRKSWR
jgi:hypothetical protein